MASIQLFLIALTTQFAVAGAAPSEKDIRTAWKFTNLAAAPELSAFFNNANAMLNLRGRPQQSATDPKPSVFIYRIRVEHNLRLAQKQEWNAFLTSQIKPGQRTVLTADSSIPGRYFMDSIHNQGGNGPPIHSLHLLFRSNHNEVILFIYDDVGNAASRNVRLVQQLYSGMNVSLLERLYRD